VNPNGVSLEQLLSALARKGIPLQFEMGTFVVLEATEKVVGLRASDRKQRQPVRVTPGAVWLSDEGELALGDVAPAGSEQEACAALIELLGALLVRSAPGVPPMLLELVEQGPSDGEWSLRRLRDDLEASLLPLNRGATRRVLSRLLREVRRDVDRGGSAPAPDVRSVDRALDDLLGLEPGELPPTPRPTPAATAAPRSTPAAMAAPRSSSSSLSSGAKTAQLLPDDVDGDALDATSLAQTVRPGARVPLAGQLAPLPSLREATATAREPARVRAERAPAREPERADPTPPAIRKPRANAREPITLSGESSPAYNDERGPRSGLDEFDKLAGEGRGGTKIALAFAAAAIGLVAAYLVIGRDSAQHALGIEPPAQAVAPAPQPAGSAQATAKRYGTLRVSSTPDRAQVLMLVGTGPALIKDLPVGVAHEFVAMADGLAPARGLVPAGASWPLEEGGPRYELAVQLNDAPAGGFELGASRITARGAATGALGKVRVVTSPPGARVYQLIGFTPDVSVENLPVDAPIELLIYAPGYALQRASIGAGDWRADGGGLVATVNAKLNKKGR
jgi:hypothetical protein